MLPNTYQSGNFIELFNAQNKDLVKYWKYTGKISKEFDSNVKGFINILHSSGISKMQIPDSDKNSLGIVQSYIVFQLFIFSSKLFNIEIGITDTSKTKRRLIFSNSSKDIIINPFHCRVPIINIPMASWTNISIDVLSFVSECFKSSTFRSIDFISVSANCKLRRVFSMRTALNETNKNVISEDLTLDYVENLPKNISFPQSVNFINYNFTYEKIRYELDEVKLNEVHSGNGNSTNNFNSVINSNFNINNVNRENNNVVLNNVNNFKNENINNMLSPGKKKINYNDETKNNSNTKNFKNNLNKIKNYDLNSAINNYNSKNNENNINQTNGISNFSNNNTNGIPNKNPRAKSYSKPNKLNKNLNNISQSNNIENILINNKSPKEEDELKDLKNNQYNYNEIKNNNLKKNLFDKNKNKMKYNVPTKINKFLKNNQANIKNNNKSSNVNSNISTSAGGKTKDENHNYSEKNKSENINNNSIKLNKQSNGLSKNENDYKSNSLLLNTLNYRNIEKWENSKDNGGDSIEEIFEVEERNINGKSIRKYSNDLSPGKNQNSEINKNISNKNLGYVKFDENNIVADREDFEELEDKFYYDIPIKDFKKKSQFKESGNFFTMKREEFTPHNQTQNLNNYYHNNINNTNTHSNNSNYNTNNQFNFSKNTNNLNFYNNFNNSTRNNPNDPNNDKSKREIIEEILRDTSSGSFFGKLEKDRPFTPPFTKLVPMNSLVSLDKISTSVDKENIINLNASVIANMTNIYQSNHEVNQVLFTTHNLPNSFKIEDITNLNGKLSLNESKINDVSYRIKDINYMDLIYDHVMGYYYDPRTNIYYELKNPNPGNNLLN